MKDVIKEIINLHESLLGPGIKPGLTDTFNKVIYSVGYQKNEDGSPKPAWGLSWESMIEGRRVWLCTVFRADAAENQREYMQFNLRFPQASMTLRAFIQRLEEMNRYLPILPCLKDSTEATDKTIRMNVSFSEHELAVIVLRAMPRVIQDEYRLHDPMQPQDLTKLGKKLEDIITASKSRDKKAQARSNGNAPRGDARNHKRTKTTATRRSNPITSKHESPTGKFCKSCAKWGGAKTSHTTLECKKWDTEGNPKDGWSKGGGGMKTNRDNRQGDQKKGAYRSRGNYRSNGGGANQYHNQSFAQSLLQQLTEFASLCKVGGEKKRSKKSRKHRRDNVSSDSSGSE